VGRARPPCGDAEQLGQADDVIRGGPAGRGWVYAGHAGGNAGCAGAMRGLSGAGDAVDRFAHGGRRPGGHDREAQYDRARARPEYPQSKRFRPSRSRCVAEQRVGALCWCLVDPPVTGAPLGCGDGWGSGSRHALQHEGPSSPRDGPGRTRRKADDVLAACCQAQAVRRGTRNSPSRAGSGL